MNGNSASSDNEVVSIPAANTYDLIMRHGVYSCPISFPVRKALYATFRKTGSTMDRLFLVKRFYESPCSMEAVKTDTTLPDVDKNQILGYLKDPEARNRLVELDPADARFGAPVRFYVLDRDRIVWLPYEAHMESPCVANVYYTLRELLDPASAPSARPSRLEEN